MSNLRFQMAALLVVLAASCGTLGSSPMTGLDYAAGDEGVGLSIQVSRDRRRATIVNATQREWNYAGRDKYMPQYWFGLSCGERWAGGFCVLGVTQQELPPWTCREFRISWTLEDADTLGVSMWCEEEGRVEVATDW